MRSRLSVILVCLGVFLAFPPLSEAQWVRAGKLKDISVFTLAVTGTHIFAGTTSGVFRSSDNGRKWTAVKSGFPANTIVMCLAVSGPNLFAGAIGHGVFLSTDNGASWRDVNSGLADSRVMCLLVDGEKIFAATMGGGVFLSTDNGASWMTVSSGLPKATSINSLFKSGHRLFAGTDYRGFFFSTDDGASWTEIKSSIDARNPVSCMAASGDDLLAGTVEGIFRSTNGGVSWEIASLALESALLGILPQTSVMCLAVNGPYVFAGTDGAGVCMSSNRDKSWSMINSGLKYTQVYALAVKGENLFAGTLGGGVWRLPLSDLSIKKQ